MDATCLRVSALRVNQKGKATHVGAQLSGKRGDLVLRHLQLALQLTHFLRLSVFRLNTIATA